MTLITESYNEKLILSPPKTFELGTLFNLKKSTNPFFFIIGAQKSGTTSLVADLVNHPQINQPSRKEFYFFNNSNVYQKGKDWYLKQFPSTPDHSLNVDATANYFESQEAPARIKQNFPNSKVVLLLRNPTERAYSHYKMAVELGVEKLSFSAALSIENDRLAYSKKHYIEKYNHDYVFQKLAYRTKGIYANQLKNWLLEYSLQDIKIVQSERYFKNPEEVLHEITSFLELDHFTPNKFNTFKQNKAHKISNETKVQLNEFYQPHNEALYNLIGQKFDW